MTRKELIHKILSSLWKNDDNVGKMCYNQALQDVQTAFDTLLEEPVSEDIQKIGSLKSYEYYPEKKTFNNTGKGVFDANMPRRKAYLRGFKDGAHAHKELIVNKTVSEDLEEAAVDYGNRSAFTDVDQFNWVLETAFKDGAIWQKEQMMASGTDRS